MNQPSNLFLSRTISTFLVAAALVFALPLMGCKQGPGDRCQLNTDCQDGYDCVLGPQMMVSSGGVCEPTGFMLSTDMTTAPIPDLSVALDGMPDMTATPNPDAGDMTPASSDGGDMNASGDMSLARPDLISLPDLTPNG